MDFLRWGRREPCDNWIVSTFFHPLTLINETGTSETIDALVDTGSSFSTISKNLLSSMGVRPFARVRLRLANGQLNEAEVGEVVAKIDELAPRTIICVFGDDDGPQIIGAHTLEAFLLGVDPLGHRLLPVDGWRA